MLPSLSPAGANVIVRAGSSFVHHRPMRSPIEAFRSAMAGSTLAALPAALRDYPGAERPSLRAAAPSQTLRYATAAADLDGDRLGDVLDVEVVGLSLQLASVTARRGIDGRALWSLRFAAPIGATVTPEAGNVLLSRFDALDGAAAGTCAAVCSEASEGSYRWTFSLPSGAIVR